MPDIKLGELVDSTAERDAIHLAVIPMVAACRLLPHQEVGLMPLSDGIAISGLPSGELIGIVDPFLRSVVEQGERFWLCLFPGTVTGMRHHWQHPAFDGSKPITGDIESSKRWLRSASNDLGITYDELIAQGCEIVNADYIDHGEPIRDRWYDLVNDGFWEHYYVVTGRDVSDANKGGFTCSC